LTCAVQNYDWGIKGGCEVSSLGELNTGAPSDPSKPYAELWMGTHPSGPSVVSATGEGLKETIAADPTAHLGAKTVERFGDDLPFLTKVLSVAKALSIQAHPDKTLAEQLHADRPNVYKDANHKPEMTLAVTEFEALCGFVAGDVLAANLISVPELRAVIGQAAADAFAASPGGKDELRAVFTALMTADGNVVAAQVDALAARLHAKPDKTPVDALACRLNEQYPKDVGVLCAYVLNYLALKPGQCIYLAANEPHAYLAGECIECMATSDNVVRAGLTPKLRDTAILCDMLTYRAGVPVVLDGERVDESTTRYVPPFDEFMLETVTVAPGATYELTKSQGPCVYLVHRGSCVVGGENARRGSVLFAAAGDETVVAAGEEGATLYRAMINSRVYA